MEVGSFIGLDLRESGEYFPRNNNIARLNSARAGIYHACRLLNCNKVHIPYYLCPTVKIFLAKKGIKVNSYYINERFEPFNIKQKQNEAVLIINYFGILSSGKLKKLAGLFKNVIIDNSAAFYSNPLKRCYNVYSPRKFFGVPDGCYVIGNEAKKFTSSYDQDISSETALFLFKRIEYGTSASYSDRMTNEERIDKADILNMSILTRSLLKSIDYLEIKDKRKENYLFAQSLYKKINMFDPTQFLDNDCVPMVYPLMIEDINLDEKLRNKKIYVGRLWKSVLRDVSEETFEARLSKYLIPVPIDQRYGKEEIKFVFDIIRNI